MNHNQLNYNHSLVGFNCIYGTIYYIIIVPNPTVSITPLNTQTVGQSLTLECSGTTMRGITSDVVLEWRHGSNTVNSTSAPTGTMDSLLVYRVFYTIPQLNTSDDYRRYNCRLTVQSNPRRRTTESVILDVTGEYFIKVIVWYITITEHCRPYFLESY